MRRINRRRVEAAIDTTQSLLAAGLILAGAVWFWISVVGPRI